MQSFFKKDKQLAKTIEKTKKIFKKFIFVI